jgi:hypothetical protein
MEDIELRAGETVRTFSKGIEYRRTNDRFEEEFIYPVVKPELNIRSVSPSIKYFREFGHDTKVDTIQFGRRYVLQGTLMPHQKMGVRWIPAG